jgi:hypothetical protein
MARHPDWFDRLDAIHELVREAQKLETLGRKEMKAIFACSDRDSIRLLHKFGAETRNNSLCLLRSSLLLQLEAIRSGSTYGAFVRQRQNVAGELASARAENRARQFPIGPLGPTGACGPQLRNLPDTITWRRSTPNGSARFEIVYRDGQDLMCQLAEFLGAAGVNRDEFFANTEPTDGSSG